MALHLTSRDRGYARVVSRVGVVSLVLIAAPTAVASTHAEKNELLLRTDVAQSGGWITEARVPRRVGSGAWSYFGDPRAVYAGGRTFVGWADARGYVHVATLDRRRVIEHERLSPRLTVDDHNNPSLYVRPDGRIMVFYSAHNGHRLFYRTSAQPFTIRSLSPARVVGTNRRGPWGYTYPNPLRVDGRLWLMFRGADWQPTFTISDQGRWTKGAYARTRTGRTRAARGTARTWGPPPALCQVRNRR